MISKSYQVQLQSRKYNNKATMDKIIAVDLNNFDKIEDTIRNNRGKVVVLQTYLDSVPVTGEFDDIAEHDSNSALFIRYNSSGGDTKIQLPNITEPIDIGGLQGEIYIFLNSKYVGNQKLPLSKDNFKGVVDKIIKDALASESAIKLQ